MGKERERREKIFAVGDIHGCYRNLTALMKRVPFDPVRDVLVFLGDYINRGPHSRQVIEYLLELQRKCTRAVFLMGNHEHLLLHYAETGDVEALRHLRNLGVEATLKSYDDAPTRSLRDLSFLPDAHRAFLMGLQLSYRSGPYLFVHADIQEESDDARPLDQVLSSRRLITACDLQEGCVTIFGHTAFDTPLVTPKRIGIDTGAAYGNVLTCLELPQLLFYHA
jgi:serine/threonine protein phosphatase 1